MHNHHEHNQDDNLADLLDLDGVVLRGYWTEAIGWVQQAADAHPTQRILDLGAGTGVGTIALAERFSDAEVLAIDLADDSLARLRHRAGELGLAPRIQTLEADLDEGWSITEQVDLTWASMSLHHLTDPDATLRAAYAATRPGGLIALAEFSEPLRVLPDSVGPGLEERCLDALRHQHAEQLPYLGADWASRLAAAGFVQLRERAFHIEVNAIDNPDALRYAQLWLGRLAAGLGEQTPDADRAALAELASGGLATLQQQGDLVIRGTRTVTLAVRDR